MSTKPGEAPVPGPGKAVALDDNPVRLLQRHVVRQRLLLLFPPGALVLDLGNTLGEDASFLAARGVRVEATGARAATLGRGEDLATFDGAYSPIGVLNGSAVRSAGAWMARAVRPGGRVLLCLAGPSPLPALLERALTGRGEARRRAGTHLEEIPQFAWPREVRSTLGARFRWTSLLGLGMLTPGPDRADWTRRNPQAFGALAALEGIVRSWPGLSAFGEQFVLEGRVVDGPSE